MERTHAVPLGDRIKSYEAQEGNRRAVPGLPIVVRLDGRGFSNFTRGMKRPFDQDFADLMVAATKYVVEKTHAVVGYTQSDEISLIMDVVCTSGGPNDDMDSEVDEIREVMFGGRFQKLNSVISGMATARFMMGAIALWPNQVAQMPPVFDGRVFQVPDRSEAVAALLWREMDATRNAVSMAARAHFSHRELQNKSSSDMRQMLAEKGINFADYPARFRRGIFLQRQRKLVDLDADTLARIPMMHRPSCPVERSEVAAIEIPPLGSLSNPVEVLFNREAPVLKDKAILHLAASF